MPNAARLSLYIAVRVLPLPACQQSAFPARGMQVLLYVSFTSHHVRLPLSSCSLPAPVDATPKAVGRKLPPMDTRNVHRSSVLCLDNLSCIWTSQNDLRQALKAVSPHIEVGPCHDPPGR